ncbi:MAG: hypothetical protein R3E97_05445 [Candidatus Eisenbacteria bacterium]
MIRTPGPALLALLLLLAWSVASVDAEIPSEWIAAMSEGDGAALDSLLREAGGDLPVDVHGQTLLHLASRYRSGDGDTDLLGRLVDAGIPVSAGLPRHHSAPHRGVQ